MNYSTAVSFIIQCLSLRHYPERKQQLTAHLASEKMEWEKLVQASSGHMVLPAFYSALQKFELLSYLPEELSDYLEQLTHLNLERNTSLLEECALLTSELNEQSLPPYFLKGTAHLLLGLYTDTAERMVGDIDLLVDADALHKAGAWLIKQGYEPINDLSTFDFTNVKHYPRLVHPQRLGAVEVHKNVISPEFENLLPYPVIAAAAEKNSHLPAVNHLLWHNCLNTQLNDRGYWYVQLNLRQLYDAFLLWHREELTDAERRNLLNNRYARPYLLLMLDLFQVPYEEKWRFRDRLSLFLRKQGMHFPTLSRAYNAVLYMLLRIRYLLRKTGQFFIYPAQRKRMLKLMRTPSKYLEHFKMLFSKQ